MNLPTTIVFSTRIKQFMSNRILDSNYASRFPGGTAFSLLAETAKSAGYDFMTSDVYAQQSSNQNKALLVSDMASGFKKGSPSLIPAVCLSLESPIIAWNFYYNVLRKAGLFEHVFLWSGAWELLKGSGSKFHDMFWPNDRRTVLTGPNWDDRRSMVMINSNKRSYDLRLKIDGAGVAPSLKRIVAGVCGRGLKCFVPWMKSDGYKERVRAIEYLSNYSEFDLYGQGWTEHGILTDKSLLDVMRKCYRGPVESSDCSQHNKWKLLGQYKFCLCFENTSFPGYITEKIFDCFFTGCIPIYWGAPDIAEHIPADTYIDFRTFRDLAALHRFVRNMEERHANRYRDAARKFLYSKAFDKFCVDSLVENIMAAVNDVQNSRS